MPPLARQRRRTRRRTAVVVGGVAHATGKRSGAKSANASQATAPADNSLTAQLEELASLKEKGLITQVEYDAKKSEILAS